MRFVAKIHVLDVLDQVVVSGYVHEFDSYDGEGVDVHEFSWSVPGVGLDDAYAWLLNSLYRALVNEQRPREGEQARPLRTGGAYTISETGDTVRSVMG